ncbi:Heme/copper-type cytochrome/quinol oxidase [Candidatus Terasakiella magnetica]|nr:Heme/copper-type cytochrome/quinol oxidase [Candidatus Terasakiella magnetica]
MIKSFAPAALLLATIILLAGWLTGRTAGEFSVVEFYTAEASSFRAKVDAQTASHGTGQSLEGIPVVHPPAGDVYMAVKRWEFSPALELEPGARYRLHLLTEDVVHSAAIDETEILLEPGIAKVVSVTAPLSGRVRIQCGEYCGLGHTKMIGSIEVLGAKPKP